MWKENPYSKTHRYRFWVRWCTFIGPEMDRVWSMNRWTMCHTEASQGETFTYTLYFASKDWKTALLYVAVYSWGQTNMAGKESSTGGSQYQSNGRNKTIPTRVKDMAESNLIGRKTLIGRIFKTGKRTFKNIFQFGSHPVHLTMEMGPIRSRFRVSQTRANRKTQIIWCPTSYCIYLKLNSASHLSPGDATSIWSSTKPSPLFSYCPFCYCTR